MIHKVISNNVLTYCFNFLTIITINITFKCPYFQVKNTTSGRQPITTNESPSIIDRSTQFNDAMQGLESIHSSHPSAHRKHSNILG